MRKGKEVRPTRICRVALAIAGLSLAVPALAQFPQLVTDFQQSGKGIAYPTQIASLGDLQVVMFQDPREGDVTTANVRPDSQAIFSTGDPPLPSTEESFVATFDGFSGAFGSTKFLDIRFQWANQDPTRWALIETLQSPQLGDPSAHLGGKIRMYVNLPNCAQFEYPGLVTPATEIGIALLISETGNNIPQGFQDFGVLGGRFEFVGVSSVADADTANPIPVPSRFIPVTDAFCEGATTGPTGHWRLVEFNLPTENVIGWTFRGGNGVLNATDIGDGVNRGVLAGIVLAVRQTDTTSDYVEFLVDRIVFEAPVTDPASAPTIASPVVTGNASVQVNDVVSRATLVTVEIDRSDDNNEDPFVADQTFNEAPGLDPNSELRFKVVNVSPALAIGDRVRARQQIGGDIGPYSLIVKVNPPAAFSATLSLDEDGNLGLAPADFEFVGATAMAGNAPQGKPVFPQNGVWQKLEYSLVPGVEPVISFAGGNGVLEPDGGQYNIDAMFFSIDTTSPNAGPYSIFLDHIYVIDVNNNKVVLADAEVANPFPNVRGQSTSINTTSIISGLASYDGIRSNRLGWSFPDTLTSNTHAPFRPSATFADSAKAVGMWLLVEDPRLSTLPLPAVEQRIIGNAPAVTVSNVDTSATLVRLLVNGQPAGTVNPAGQTSVNVTPSVTLMLGDSVSANYDAPGRATSDVAYARVVQIPPAPTVQNVLVAGQTTVAVSNVLNTGNSVASQVRLLANGVQIGSLNPAGQASVTFNVSPALSVGQQITARQTVNGYESPDSSPVAVGTGDNPRVVINEIQYDDPGVDDREFIEIYNAEPFAIDISGWQIRASDTVAPPGDDNPDFVIPNGTILPPGGFYVIGQATVPNVNLIIPNDRLENDNEAYELLDENGVVLDTLITERNKGPVAVSPAEGGIWGNFQSFIDAAPQSIGRWLDGYDTDNNGRDFGIRLATPGASNNAASLAPYTENFNGASDTDVPNWTGSFVSLKHINPTAVSSHNPGVIPASPQGGNAAICVDPSGGGNECSLTDAARFNVAFSCYVYINTANPGFVSGNTNAEYETWSIGLGCPDALHNGFHFGTASANGNTGLMWQWVIIEDANTGNIGSMSLQFVDRNDGENDGTVLLDVPAELITTGWHFISITRNYENVSASYDSLTYSGTRPLLGPASLSMGYREFVVGFPGTLRPPTIDAVSITEPTPPPLGACCLPLGCQVLTNAMCSALGGVYAGTGTNCAQVYIPIPFDWNGNSVVEPSDWQGLNTCLAGPDAEPDSPSACGSECLDAFDNDGDGDVDMADVAAFQDAL